MPFLARVRRLISNLIFTLFTMNALPVCPLVLFLLSLDSLGMFIVIFLPLYQVCQARACLVSVALLHKLLIVRKCLR